MKTLIRPVICCLWLILFCSTFVGCSKERVVSDDPAEIEKQRQAHIEMTRREMQER